MKFTLNQKRLRRRVLTIINDVHTSHIGSCLSIVDILDAIYAVKKKDEKFILSNGHAAAALYVVLEKYKYLSNANLTEYGVHPDRNIEKGIDLSTGSLGQGLPITIGMALANKKKNVYCLISDGECAEGSIWESLRVIYDKKIINLKIIVSANGWGAYDPIDIKILERRFKGFGFKIVKIDGHESIQMKQAIKTNYTEPTIIFAKTISDQFPFLVGQDAHYYTMNEDDYKSAMKILA